MKRRRNATRDPAQESTARRRRTHFAEIFLRELGHRLDPRRLSLLTTATSALTRRTALPMTVIATSPGLQGERRAARLPTRSCSGRSATSSAASSTSARRGRKLPEFEPLRDAARDIKNHTLAHLDFYLEDYEAKVTAAGGAGALRAHRRGGARRRAGDLPRGRRAHRHQGQVDDLRGDRAQRAIWRRTASRPVETDLGEYIIQLRNEMPEPHHRARVPPQRGAGRGRISAACTRSCRPEARLRRSRDILAEARAELRERFLAADVGITGANFLIAETGTSSSSPTRATAT